MSQPNNQFTFGPAAKQTIPTATQDSAGLMSSSDKTKLDGVATGATANVVSNSLTDTSTTNALSAAKGKELNDRTHIRSYDSVTDLSLTSGSATILQIWNAMEDSSILFIPSSELVSSDRPASADSYTVMVCKRGDYRGYIIAFSKGAYTSYTMGLYATTYNGNDSNKPSGEWIILSSYVAYGVCSTAAATQVKEVIADLRGNALGTGIKLYVKFENSQTYNGQPKLKLNNTSATDITINSSTGSTALPGRYEWYAGDIVEFLYDGTSWVIVGGQHATTTYWGKTKLSDSLTSTSTILAATANSVKQVNDSIASLSDSLFKMAGQTYINNNSSFSIKLNTYSAVFLFYRSYQPNILYITDNGTVTVVVGKNESITVTASGSVLTITNTIGWGLPFAWIKTGNPPA